TEHLCFRRQARQILGVRARSDVPGVERHVLAVPGGAIESFAVGSEAEVGGRQTAAAIHQDLVELSAGGTLPDNHQVEAIARSGEELAVRGEGYLSHRPRVTEAHRPEPGDRTFREWVAVEIDAGWRGVALPWRHLAPTGQREGERGKGCP